MTRRVVDTAKMLKLCQRALASGEPRIEAAAESVMSALAYNLRHEQAILAEELKGHIQTLRDYSAGCKVNNASKTRTNQS